jgi:hypothetical protein
MRRYYFDLQFGDQQPSQDEEGTVLPGVEAAQLEAARSLSDFSRQIAENNEVLSTLAIHVRDDAGPVLIAVLHFEIRRLG